MLSQKSIARQIKKLPSETQHFVDDDDLQEGDVIVPRNKYQEPTSIDDEDGGSED